MFVPSALDTTFRVLLLVIDTVIDGGDIHYDAFESTRSILFKDRATEPYCTVAKHFKGVEYANGSLWFKFDDGRSISVRMI